MKINIVKMALWALWALWGLMIVAVFGVAVMVLWNWLLPDIFGFAGINLWQALGLFVLARILFGSFNGKHWLGAHIHHNPIREKWMKMTPEERKEFVLKRHDLFHKHHFHFRMEGGFGSKTDGMPAKENE
ncbi:MAG: hypothetical protein LBS03_09785 [Bacteroidales bacterium]|jgi:hypothetical protein|nr:hypothetical protein [Bacteroidales bacterium]